MAVEEPQIETLKTSEALLHFPPHPRRHLQSQTYLTLVRIFSHCYDDSQPSPSTHNLHKDLRNEKDGNELGQRTESQASQFVELVGSDNTQPQGLKSDKNTEVNLNVDDKCSLDSRHSQQLSIDEIDKLMRIDENEDLPNQKDASDFQEPEFGPELVLIDELECIVKGSEDTVLDNNSKPPVVSLVQNQSGIDEVVVFNNQKEHVDSKQIDSEMSVNVSQKALSLNNVVIGESVVRRENSEDIPSLLNTTVLDAGTVRQQNDRELNYAAAMDLNNSSVSIIEAGKTERTEFHGENFSEASSFNKTTLANTSGVNNGNDDKTTGEPDALKEVQEMSLKDIKLDESVSCGIMGDVDMEEGEISGGFSVDDISMDMLLQDAVLLEGDKVNEESIPDTEELSCKVATERDSESTFSLLDNNNGMGFKESDKTKAVSKPDVSVNEILQRASKVDANDALLETTIIEKNNIVGSNKLVLHGIIEEDATDHDKPATEDSGKKKRRLPTKERRAKKKLQKQKKRAENNRKLGVKRLKLPPILKPKTVSYCRHFMVGRCYEGDKCKFSHDTVPLTKSKPCCHFARNSCMKGDDCPFDHQLSKYPCSNFASAGYCSRGDNCMFSHKIVPKEDATTSSNAMEPEKKVATLMNNSKFKEQLKEKSACQQPFSVSSFSTGISSHKNTGKNKNETFLKQEKSVPKGINFLSVGSLPLVDSVKLKQQILSPNRIAGAGVGNHLEQHGSGIVQNSNEILNKSAPIVAPKGVNFLSFGRSQQDDFSSRTLVSTPSSGDSSVKLSSDNSVMLNQTNSAPKSNLMLKGIQPAVTPKGINFFSFRKSSVNDSLDKLKLPFSCDDGSDSSVNGRQYPLDEQKHSCTTSKTLPSSSVSLAQSPDPSSSRFHKDTAHSAQKALLSTLAFAAKHESRVKQNELIRDPSGGTEIDKGIRENSLIGGSQNGLAKVSRIVELLSSFSGKSKQ
ncbi:uncharacterized protein LOC115705191 isoform X2 [Cannabis sativa]|uniref:uncharacterized protein LOC115705191 isoform X2 n=1 Tax=Cannabis sativa TaxID=3483 RepID=UPI0029C9EB95|nr:uncharacterized protein LOC115705191 isoform X2 [Cannabis sativa]XP_060961004.1 uncharacterized protein LOC115705191 isoform X2 [Cannabis sativa]XP_060961011.1 uncharacterized protein LOC115705191 isoform X2 [Cannabis sativa]